MLYKFVTQYDFGIEDDAMDKKLDLNVKNEDLLEDRELEEDLGGIDRY